MKDGYVGTASKTAAAAAAAGRPMVHAFTNKNKLFAAACIEVEEG